VVKSKVTKKNQSKSINKLNPTVDQQRRRENLLDVQHVIMMIDEHHIERAQEHACMGTRERGRPLIWPWISGRDTPRTALGTRREIIRIRDEARAAARAHDHDPDSTRRRRRRRRRSPPTTILWRRAAVVGAVGLAGRPCPELLQVQPPERLDDEDAAAARQRLVPCSDRPAAAAQGPRLRAEHRQEQHHRHDHHHHR